MWLTWRCWEYSNYMKGYPWEPWVGVNDLSVEKMQKTRFLLKGTQTQHRALLFVTELRFEWMLTSVSAVSPTLSATSSLTFLCLLSVQLAAKRLEMHGATGYHGNRILPHAGGSGSVAAAETSRAPVTLRAQCHEEQGYETHQEPEQQKSKKEN